MVVNEVEAGARVEGWNGIETLLRRAEELEPLPASATRLTSLFGRRDWRLEDIAATIELDPALTGRLLSRVNSVIGGSRLPIHTVESAIMRLGSSSVLSMALAGAMFGSLKAPLPAYGLDEGDLWRHSVAAALAIEEAPRVLPILPPPEAFVAALLHDVGKLVLARVHGPGLLAHRRAEAHELLARECDELGLDHAALGYRVACHWRLSPRIATAIACHHGPDGAPDERGRLLASFVALGDAVAHYLGHGSGGRPHLSRSVVERLGLTKHGFLELCEHTNTSLADILELYE